MFDQAPVREASRPLEALVVEDDEELLAMLGTYLTHHGVHVTTASDGAAAMVQARTLKPDVIITDLMMPGINGPELIAQVRKDAELSQTPVIVTSAAFFNERDASSFRRRHNANAVFQKPLPLRKVMEATVQLGEEYRAVCGQRVSDTPKPGTQREALASDQPTVLSRSEGPGGLPELCRLLTEIFDGHVGGILEVKSAEGARKVHFRDGMVVATSSEVEDERLNSLLLASGLVTDEQVPVAQALMEKDGIRFGYAAVKVANIPPSAVARALEEQTLWVTMQALASQGAWTFKQAPESVALGAQLYMDPVDAIQRVCLDCVSSQTAESMLKDLGVMSLRPSPQAHERAWLLRSLRPFSPVLAHLNEVGLQLPEGLAKLHADNAYAANHLLALYLSRALVPETLSLVVQRVPVVATFGGVWRPAHLPSEQLALRESIALEWLRSAGMKPHDILGVDSTSPAEHVRLALATKMDRFSAERLGHADLGPARRCLAVLKERWSEAANLMNVH